MIALYDSVKTDNPKSFCLTTKYPLYLNTCEQKVDKLVEYGGIIHPGKPKSAGRVIQAADDQSKFFVRAILI